MKYKEFVSWCSERAADGCWGFNEAAQCLNIIAFIQEKPFWKREKEWQRFNAELDIENRIVAPINRKIEEFQAEAERKEDGKK